MINENHLESYYRHINRQYTETQNRIEDRSMARVVQKVQRKTRVGKKPDLLTSALRAIRAVYPNDTPAPGLVLSQVTEGEWYASICRYEGIHKVVMFKSKGISIESALKRVMKEFLKRSEVFDTLRRAL